MKYAARWHASRHASPGKRNSTLSLRNESANRIAAGQAARWRASRRKNKIQQTFSHRLTKPKGNQIGSALARLTWKTKI
jgi:hypothetical protein